VKCEEMNMVYTVKKSLKWTFTCMWKKIYDFFFKCIPIFLLAIDGYFLCRYVPSSIKASCMSC
jgi:hypothetical protein